MYLLLIINFRNKTQFYSISLSDRQTAFQLKLKLKTWIVLWVTERAPEVKDLGIISKTELSK